MQRVNGWVEKGSVLVSVGGLTSSTKVQGSFPLATVTVYITGTVTLAPIFSDNNTVPTPLANPFTASSVGVFGFYAPNGSYDIVFSGGGLSAPYTIPAVRVFDESSLVIDVTAAPYFADNTGVADSAAKFRAACLAAAALGGGIVWAPSGTYKWLSAVQLGGAVTLKGAGIEATTINVVASEASDLAGASVTSNNSGIKDFTLFMNKSTGSRVRGVSLDADVEGVNITRVAFEGSGDVSAVPNDCWAIYIDNLASVSRVRIYDCVFTNVDYCWGQTNSYTGECQDVVVDNPHVYKTIVGFNFNHPDASGFTKDVTVRDGWFNTIIYNAGGSWGVAFSGKGIKKGRILNCAFSEAEEQAIHVEDEADNILVDDCEFSKCASQFGSGNIQVINEASDVTISKCSFDLTDASIANDTCGVRAAAGGGAGAPNNIKLLGNTFKTKSDTIAWSLEEILVAVVSDNTHENPDVADKADFFARVVHTFISGSGNRFINPATVLQSVNDEASGTLSASFFSGDFTNFAILDGPSGGSTSVVFDGFTIRRPFIVGNPGAVNKLFPAGTGFRLSIALRYDRGATVSSFTAQFGLNWDGTDITILDLDNFVGGDTSGIYNITESAGDIVAKGLRVLGTLSDGFIILTATGPYIG